MEKHTSFKTILGKYIPLIIFSLFIATGHTSAQGWTLDFDFDNGEPGEQVTEFSDASGHTYYDTSVVYAGTNSAQMNIQQGAEGFGFWGGRKQFPSELGEGDELWIRLRTFFPTDFNFNTNLAFLKFLRVHIREDDGTHIGY
ncbi:MAG: hypothetical protein L3J22_11915 [Xanthomonadales bacterium]|nr:hypothetical protein [Xanthomonadales bacterium]